MNFVLFKQGDKEILVNLDLVEAALPAGPNHTQLNFLDSSFKVDIPFGMLVEKVS
jgi:hypothetical protein